MAACRRLVVKVGSAVLADTQGLCRRRVHLLASQLAALKADGCQLALVTSGAVASGRAKIEALRGAARLSMPQKQAAAALGQAGLMHTYEEALEVHGVMAAQVLLTAQDLRSRERYRNVSNTLNTLLEWGALPIINENDSVSTQEIKLGDNDNLAALLTNLLGADLLINLTNVDGLLDGDPALNPEARLIPLVEKVESSHLQYAGLSPNAYGAGGILSKIRAAEQAGLCGAYTVIANGGKEGILSRIMAGEEEGTLFMPNSRHYPRRKHWIAFAARRSGEIVVDPGARSALLVSGKSLLAAGVREVRGEFQAGDALRVLDQEHKLIAVGLSNYDHQELRLIKGLRSRQIAGTLGRQDVPEVIHRDNLVILSEQNE
jgi:glutamate 5-kinase